MAKAIGGYFELELPIYEEYHKDALRLNSGKNCLEYILRCRNFTKVYIPYYTCLVVLKSFQKLGISYEFYHININLELSQDIHLKQGEALLYTNYFGLKQRYTEKLSQQYGNRLIVDNTQSFFSKPMEGIDTFYSCRKFFGVPDGAYLYTNTRLDEEIEQDCSYHRMNYLLKRIDLSAEDGFADFRRADDRLGNQPIKQMSKLTQRMMQGLDYKAVAQRRRANYQLIDAALGHDNILVLPLEDDAVPMVYPYLVSKKGLREKLIEKRIFLATYWPNVLKWTTKEDFDYSLAFLMLPLPIDQRYGEEEMRYIIRKIQEM